MTEYCCCGCNGSVSKSFHGYCLHTGLKVFAGFCCPEEQLPRWTCKDGEIRMPSGDGSGSRQVCKSCLSENSKGPKKIAVIPHTKKADNSIVKIGNQNSVSIKNFLVQRTTTSGSSSSGGGVGGAGTRAAVINISKNKDLDRMGFLDY